MEARDYVLSGMLGLLVDEPRTEVLEGRAA
jgi:hypothetical protein